MGSHWLTCIICYMSILKENLIIGSKPKHLMKFNIIHDVKEKGSMLQIKARLFLTW